MTDSLTAWPGWLGGLLAAGHDPISHVADEVWVTAGGLRLMSKHVFVQLAVVSLLCVVLASAFARRVLVPRGVRNAVEAVCIYFREQVARPNLKEHTDTFIPYIWTVFFFVAGCNVAGMIPFSATATGNIWVTATLAVVTMLLVVINGLRYQGRHYVEHFFPGPAALKPLMGVLEIMGLFTKGFALAVRLFANMIAGHILIAVLMDLIGRAADGMGTGGGLAVAAVIVPSLVALNLLELFVALLQGFIFTFLTCLFLGQAINIEHHDGHHEEHGADGHGHGHDHEGGHAPGTSAAGHGTGRSVGHGAGH